MKKVLSLVLALSLVLGTFAFTPVFAATSFDDTKGEACEDAVNVLTELGVVTGYEDGTYKPENIVTRAEMAVLIINALGLDQYIADQTSNFTDLSGYGWAEPYIAYAQSLGFINGYGDGTFRPGNTVSYDEAATMLVGALGYNSECLPGTWPANFVTKAKSLGIMDDIVSSAGGANRGDIAIMIFNTLDQWIGYVDKDGVFQAYQDKAGVANDNMLMRLGADQYNDGNYFIMTSDIADDALVNVREYIGAAVKAYCTDEDREVIAISEVKSTFLTGEFDEDGMASVTKFTTADDTEYTLANGWDVNPSGTSAVDGFGSVFMNAEFNEYYTASGAAFDIDKDTTYTVAVDLSSKTIKSVYSISEWIADDDDLFTTDDEEEITEDQSLFGIDFPLNDDQEIDLEKFELIGVNSLDDIEVDDVVYVYAKGGDIDDDIARVAVGTEVVTGEITKVNSDGDEVTIEGAVYKIADESGLTASYFDGKAGDTYTLYLDAYGKIYDAEKGAGEPDNYAVVLDYTAEANTGLGGTTPQFKLFLADGTTKTFDVDTDAIEEGDIDFASKSAASANITISGVNAGDLVSYDLNRSGEIDDLKAAGDETAVSKAISAKGYFDGKQIESDAVIFTYDGNDPSSDSNYSVAQYDSVLDSDTIDSATYKLEDNKIVAMLLDGFSAGDDVYGVFTGYSSVNGDYDYEVTLLIDGKEVTYNSDKTYNSFVGKTEGVYKLKFDGSGALSDNITAAEAVAGGSVDETTYTAISVSDGAISRSGNTLTHDGTTYTLDSSYVVYEWSEDDGCYIRGNIRDIVNTTTGAGIQVMLFDVYDDDQAYDVVMWYK